MLSVLCPHLSLISWSLAANSDGLQGGRGSNALWDSTLRDTSYLMILNGSVVFISPVLSVKASKCVLVSLMNLGGKDRDSVRKKLSQITIKNNTCFLMHALK